MVAGDDVREGMSDHDEGEGGVEVAELAGDVTQFGVVGVREGEDLVVQEHALTSSLATISKT